MEWYPCSTDSSGSLEINGAEISFEGGKGYIEKDWGRSMPSDWIWIQSNHFEDRRRGIFYVIPGKDSMDGGIFPRISLIFYG